MAYAAASVFSNAKEVMEITIPVPWGHIAGKAWNDPNGIRVLLVHGIQDNAGGFDTLVPLFPDSYYCVAIDIPGHGRSSSFPKGLPIKLMDYTTAIDRVVDYLGWDKFIYIGHSLGGHIGFLYSAFFNERVEKMVILDSVLAGLSNETAIHNLVSTYRDLKDTEERVDYGKAPEYTYEAAIRRLRDGRPDPISEKAAQTLAKRNLIRHGSGFRFSMDQRLKSHDKHRMNTEQLIELFRLIKCPILHLMTTETVKLFDQVETFKPLREFLKHNLGEDYRYHVIDGYHSVHMDYPEKVSDYVVNFLTNTKCQL